MPFIDTIAYAVSSRSRATKHRQFIDLIKPQPSETILDVGVNDEEYSITDNYLEKHYQHPENITAISKESLKHFSQLYPNIRVVIADGTKIPFPDNNFDIIYSNAVIEHVGSREKQKEFLHELFRVGHRGYLTTPNRYFPIETHTRIPLLHLILPKRYFDGFLRFIGKDWATGNYMHLLTKKDLVRLLNKVGIQNYQIIPNRFLGFTMTFTIIWHKN